MSDKMPSEMFCYRVKGVPFVIRYACDDLNVGDDATLYHHEDTVKALEDKVAIAVTVLERLCAEAYIALGALSDYLPNEKILDNLSELKVVHEDVLPFVEKVGVGEIRTDTPPKDKP